MPTYDYRCNDCGRAYDVFHKVREVVEDVVCPACVSTSHTRLLSAPNVAVGTKANASPATDRAMDFGGCCGGGACGIN
jgi:putative FmdB family regulatory protein